MEHGVMTKESLIHTSLQRGENEPGKSLEPFQRFVDKPLKRLDEGSELEATSLKRAVNESASAKAGALHISSSRFRNALARVPQTTPPIWLMRQAGRYHRHYQDLRRQFSFMDLCKQPELAAHVAL